MIYKIKVVVGFNSHIFPLCYSDQLITHALRPKVILFPIDQCIYFLAFYCFDVDVIGMILEYMLCY